MMSYSNLVSLFLFFILFASSSSSSSFNTGTCKCSAKQSDDLLSFKQNLFSINFSIDDPLYYSPCQDWLGSDYSPIMSNWNTSRDCCNWNGVTCDPFTGDVIALDLSCGMLQGTIHSNASLYNLPHLERLNLAFNSFTSSQLPRKIGRFSKTLTHFNISNCGFSGQVPMEITLLHRLVSLDLSWNYGFSLGPLVFENLLRNTTSLKELSLEYVDIFSALPTYLNFSSSMKLLNLHFSRLQGKIPHNIFDIRSLETLDLSENSFTGQIPSKISRLPKLISLDLSWNGLDKLQIQPHTVNTLLENSTLLRDLSFALVNIGLVLPKHLNISSSLKSLDLSYTSLRGKLPDNIFNLQHLEELSLSGNNDLTGPLPKVNTSTTIPLKLLDLSATNMSGEKLDSIGHLKSLNQLHLSGCGFVGSLPSSLGNCKELSFILLSHNMLNGTLPSSLSTLPSLEYMMLNNNMFSGDVLVELFSLGSLRQLDLGHNQLTGQIDVLDQSPILQTFRQLTNLILLDISYNNFRGEWDLNSLLSSLTNLAELRLSYSGLSVLSNSANRYVNPDFGILHLASCNLKVLPESLRAMKNLKQLNLSRNSIHGNLPDWVGEIGGNGLLHLDLSHNAITSLPQFQWQSVQTLHLKSNLIEGPFPQSICNMSILIQLDMSNNSFSGTVPRCLGNISSILGMVDLGNNRFHGTIPNVYKKCEYLEGYILNGNQLEGELPSSLSLCRSLRVIDVGNNHLNGTFPVWLGDLPKIQVIVLKSNNFHGPIDTSSMVEFPFPSLQVLDLSHNGYVGQLPGTIFQNLKAMKNVVKKSTKPSYLNISGLYYSITVDVKGVQQDLIQILVGYTIINLSNNRLEGEIPNTIGSLNSLKVLNLSRNNLNGRITSALGNLLEIESLDLSWNQLTGEIPQNLADIRGLAVLNLSHNHLVGRIPVGKQFNTFEGDSFGGNLGLCGFPLLKKCEHSYAPQLEDDGDEKDDDSLLERNAVILGCGCGALIGLAMGYVMLSTGKPKWFNAIADALEQMIF